MKQRYSHVLILWVGLLAAACSDTNQNEDNISLGDTYFVTRDGATWIYTIDSLAYDNNAGITTIDTFQYVYMEKLNGIYTSDAGENWGILERYVADSIGKPWQRLTNWLVLKNEWYALRNEENRVFVKLVFPLNDSKNWNGNKYNSLGTQTYRVVAYQIPFGNFENTVLVRQINDSNAIEVIRKEERYAASIGVVYAKYDSLNTQVNGTRGFRKQYRLLSYE